MKIRRIKIKFLVFILSVILIIILLIVVAITKKNEPLLRQKDKEIENNLSATTTTNTEERNEELEASKKSESKEENSDTGSVFKGLIKGIKQQETLVELISEDPDVNLEELSDRNFSRPKRKEIGIWVGKAKENIEEKKTKK